MSNQELADYVGDSLQFFAEQLMLLQKQQRELAERIRFVYPTEGDIAQEVDEFIRKTLAA